MSTSRSLLLIHPPPRVTESVFVDRWIEALRAEGFELVGLTPRTALRHPRAPVHVHWPEHLYSHPSRSIRIAKAISATLLMLVLWCTPRRTVWTAHNLAPHVDGRSLVSRVGAAALRRRLAAVVVLAPNHEAEVIGRYPELRGVRFAYIGFGSMAPDAPEPPPTRAHDDDRPVRFVHIGIVMPYKAQLEVLAGLAPLLRSGQVELVIVGRIGDEAYAKRVRAAAASLPNVDLRDRYADDTELATAMQRADVAIGVQTTGFNTGVVAAAVPFGLPVVTSPTAQAEHLRTELGDDWILTISDLTDPEEWRSVLGWARRERAPLQTDVFDWATIAARHRELYESATSSIVASSEAAAERATARPR